MFFRMLRGVIVRQRGKMLMIALTIALGASLATAMLNVMMDVGDKVNQELKTYGANITVYPQSASVLRDLYALEGDEQGAYLDENDLPNIKSGIFWGPNIVDYAPFIDATVSLENGGEATLVGSWFNHHIELDTGETLDTGVKSLRSWWALKEGRWLDESAGDEDGVMVGATLAQTLGVHAGDAVAVSTDRGEKTLTVLGVYESGDDADDQLYALIETVQALTGTEGKLTSIEVSAITTPDNELAIRAAQDPSKLSIDDYETWYCTAYVSSICYQIQDVVANSIASPVRQVAESEGSILEKTELLMILITILSLVGSALGITNLVTASVMERGQEIGLLKAIGAHDGAVSLLVLTEIIITAVIGGVIGYFAGFGFAQIIGRSVFGSAIEMKGMVIPIVAVLVVAVSLAGSIPAIRTLQRLRPAEVLHGR